MISLNPVALVSSVERRGESHSRAPPQLADWRGSVKFVIIQWHICAFTGSAREVASGSERTRVYVVLLLRVRVEAMVEASMLKTGGQVTFFGLILFPKSTVLCLDAYDSVTKTDGWKSSRTART